MPRFSSRFDGTNDSKRCSVGRVGRAGRLFSPAPPHDMHGPWQVGPGGRGGRRPRCVPHCPRGKYGLPPIMMALITSGFVVKPSRVPHCPRGKHRLPSIIMALITSGFVVQLRHAVCLGARPAPGGGLPGLGARGRAVRPALLHPTSVAGTPSSSLLKRLLKGEEGAAE